MRQISGRILRHSRRRAGGVFRLANVRYRILGKAGSKAVSKVASLLLAAMAVMMVRKGLMGLIAADAA